MNSLPKQNEVQLVVTSNNLGLCALLETHILPNKLQSICNRVFGSWIWTSNSQDCERGTRIVVGWDPSRVNLMVLNQSDQVIHCQINLISKNKSFFCSFIYVGNKVVHRRLLWENLRIHKRFVSINPWIVLGDFNVSLNIEDSSAGFSGISRAQSDFKDC